MKFERFELLNISGNGFSLFNLKTTHWVNLGGIESKKQGINQQQT